MFVGKYWPVIWYVLGRQRDAAGAESTRAFLRCCLGEDNQEWTQRVKGSRPRGALSSAASLDLSKRMQTGRATGAGLSRGAARIVWDEIQSVIKGGHILPRELTSPSIRTRLQVGMRHKAASRPAGTGVIVVLVGADIATVAFEVGLSRASALLRGPDFRRQR